MENEEILQYLSKMDKKLDKILKLTTTIAKTLHIVPVNEKEEREIQVLQLKNAGIIKKVQDELAELTETKDDSNDTLSIMDLFNASEADVYGDIIGEDYIQGEK